MATPAPTAPPDPLVGTVVGGKYLVEAVLADGGTSRVYRAIQQPLGRPVALKLVNVEGEDLEGRSERVFREATAAAALRHPNVVVVHDVGFLPDHRCYIVMELLEGRSLSEILRGGPLSEERALELFTQIVRGLRHAHQAGFVHRDIKPGNVMVVPGEDGRSVAKILDFGLVKQLGRGDVPTADGVDPDTTEEITAVGAFLGTPQYIAPEQASGVEPDGRADIYAAGVMLYRTLTGVLPFEGESAAAFMAAHLRRPVPLMRDRAPAVAISAGVEAIVRRCMQKRPEDRYPDADALLAALAAASHPPAPPPPVVTLPEPPPPRAPWFVAGLGLAFAATVGLAAIAGVGWTVTREEPAPVVDVPVLEVTEPAVEVEAGHDVWLLLSSSPSGAQVSLDGIPLGATPLAQKVHVTVPEVTFDFTLSGYAEATLPLDVSGEQASGDVTLKSTAPPPKKAAPVASVVIADGVRFDSAEAKRALKWVNTASKEQLRAAGIAAQQANVLLEHRPYADLGAVAETPYIGEKTLEAIKGAR